MKNWCRAIFFDAGDTLIYAPLEAEEIFVEICRQYGVVLSFDKVRKAYDLFARSKDFFQRNKKLYDENTDEYWDLCNECMLEFLGIKENATSLAKQITNNFPSLSEIEWRVYSDVPDALAELKKEGMILGVVSNFDPSLQDILTRVSLAHHFETIVASEKVGFSKPDPKIFSLALESVAVKPEEAIYVGDSYESDIVGSRLAGLTPVLIDRNDVYEIIDCLKIKNLRELIHHLSRKTISGGDS